MAHANETVGAQPSTASGTPGYQPRAGRVAIRARSPRQPGDLWPAKAFVGEVVPFEATVFVEGHVTLGVELLLSDPDGVQKKHRMRLLAPGTDRWQAKVQLEGPGTWHWSVGAWVDDWASWLHAAEIKIAASAAVPIDEDVELTLADGVALLTRPDAADRPALAAAAKVLGNTKLSPAERLAAAHDPRLLEALEANPLTSLTTLSLPLELRVERNRAAVGSWYEFFPRSEGAKRRKDGSWQSGTFRTAARRLPAIARMGFDVVYLPPIQPIGTSHRKGPNNTLGAGPNDPGSPWAIGSPAGGHDAIHPDLGTVDDFSFFVGAARNAGLEIALDLALQCSPDHPWVTEHPEWFTHRADGSIAYAENPPKKYQDIYPLNFDNDPEGIRDAVLRVIEHWIALGISIFRVDNPHTKPLQFWEWLLHEVSERHPDTVFLAEAFTRPAMLQGLAQIGFHQSYSYFTWRNTKAELEGYLAELSQETSDYLRPNLFVNTPDILSEYLQTGGEPAYRIRAAIAATASPSWGIYSGYELIENIARPGSEENIDNEKYEYRPRQWAAAEAAGTSIAPFLTKLNRIRGAHPALRQLRNLDVHWSDDEQVLVYTKHLDGAHVRSGHSDGVIVIANVDPHAAHETMVHLDTEKLGIPLGSTFEVTDLITRETYRWGEHNYVRLDPATEPVHILSVDYRTVRGGGSANAATSVAPDGS